METGIYIRAQIDGKWDSVDIGDKRLSAEQVVEWLRSRGEKSDWAEQTVLALLNKRPGTGRIISDADMEKYSEENYG